MQHANQSTCTNPDRRVPTIQTDSLGDPKDGKARHVYL